LTGWFSLANNLSTHTETPAQVLQTKRSTSCGTPKCYILLWHTQLFSRPRPQSTKPFTYVVERVVFLDVRHAQNIVMNALV